MMGYGRVDYDASKKEKLQLTSDLCMKAANCRPSLRKLDAWLGKKPSKSELVVDLLIAGVACASQPPLAQPYRFQPHVLALIQYKPFPLAGRSLGTRDL